MSLDRTPVECRGEGNDVVLYSHYTHSYQLFTESQMHKEQQHDGYFWQYSPISITTIKAKETQRLIFNSSITDRQNVQKNMTLI